MAKIEEIIKKINPKLEEPVWQHKLIYNSSSETLEPIYFWILDFMKTLGFEVEKLIDNFSSTPSSGYFSEMSGKATRMQEEGMKILGVVNQIIKSVVNIIYDLKEFEIRLAQYDLANSKKKEEADAGLLGLKQIWMDNVDVKRGRGSINALSYELNFTTLRDAFMAARDLKAVDELGLNDKVKRILKPRVAEFLEWRKRSEVELRKRFEIEKSYLKSQIATIKMYARWVKPYLRAAEKLMERQQTDIEPALVSAFNTMVMELELFSKKKINVSEEARTKKLPPAFQTLKLKRDYFLCVFLDFYFRGIPQRVSQSGHYVFGGRAEVSFKAYAFNSEEIAKLKEELEEGDFQDILKVSETQVTESLEQIHDDLEHFLKGEPEKEKPKGLWQNFLASLSGKKEKPQEKPKLPREKEKGKKPVEIIKKDNYAESIIRAYAESQAAAACFKFYDVYKKAHGMASVPFMEE